MVGSMRILLPLLIFCLLLNVGESAGRGMEDMSTLHPLVRLTRRLSSAVTTSCPGQLENCITPRIMREAYGIDSLFEKALQVKGKLLLMWFPLVVPHFNRIWISLIGHSIYLLSICE